MNYKEMPFKDLYELYVEVSMVYAERVDKEFAKCLEEACQALTNAITLDDMASVVINNDTYTLSQILKAIINLRDKDNENLSGKDD